MTLGTSGILSFRATFRLTCAALLACAMALPLAVDASAQGVTRIKARLTAFDGQAMTLQPLTAKDAPAPGDPLTVSVLPQTQYVQQQKSFFGAIKPGDYVGAAVSERAGRLRAQNVYLYAPVLRGSGEGRFVDNGRLMVNGTIREVRPTRPDSMFDGTLILHYRGATLTGARKNAVCEGRAVPPAFASALACSADATIEVLPGTPVSTLTLGDKSLLAPGAILSLAMTRQLDGSQVSPGIIVEMPQSPP
jgi:hypothetical protein